MPENAPPPEARRPGPFGAALGSIRSRIVSGLILALPIAITFGILFWTYYVLKEWFLDPTAKLVNALVADRLTLPSWWVGFVSPLIAAGLVLILLYLLGYFLHSSLHRALDWILLRVPVVTTVYKAVRNVFEALEAQRRGEQFKRVVLVSFPHPGMRSLGMVTRTLADAQTGRPILCVVVLTGVMPPSGFTLFVPEEEVTDIDWSVNQALQAIVSGGITAPGRIQYVRDGHLAPASGPIVDPTGRPAHG